MKIIFFGTPEYVIPVFESACGGFENGSVVCAVTRSDKPSGRHLHSAASPIKRSASEKKIPVLTPENLKDKEFIFQLSSLNSQLGIVAAYGKILPKEVLDIFPMGCVNLHFSLLPKYRGAAPIQWSLIKGEKETGVTTFFMDEGLDTGKIIFQKKTVIGDNDDTEVLKKKLVPIAIDVLREALAMIKSGCTGKEQKGEIILAPPLKKSDGRIDWNKSAFEIHNLIRGARPWPAAYTEIGSRKSEVGSLKILEAEIFSAAQIGGPASGGQSHFVGSIVSIQKNTGFVVKCGKGFILVKSVQPVSKKIMSAWAYLLGHNLKIGDKLSG